MPTLLVAAVKKARGNRHCRTEPSSRAKFTEESKPSYRNRGEQSVMHGCCD